MTHPSTLLSPAGRRGAAVGPRWGAADRRRAPCDLEVVVPAFNEELRIGATLDALLTYLSGQPLTSSVVVVDNGSVDRTAEVVDRVAAAAGLKVPVTLIGCSARGKGAAVRRGVLTSPARWVGFCDADLATPVATLDRVIPLLRGGSPVVIGSRRCQGASFVSSQPPLRRAGGWTFRRLTRHLTDGLSDTQCGFKFFSAEAARMLFASSRVDGFAFDLELMATARAQGLSVVEVPVSWTAASGSTFRAFSDGSRAWRDMRAVGQRLARPGGA